MKTEEQIIEEIKGLEQRKKQAEVLFLKCEAGIEVLQKILVNPETEDKAVGKKEK